MKEIILKNKKYFLTALEEVIKKFAGGETYKVFLDHKNADKLQVLALALHHQKMKSSNYLMNFRRFGNILCKGKYVYRWEYESPIKFNEDDFKNKIFNSDLDGSFNLKWNKLLLKKNIFEERSRDSIFQEICDLGLIDVALQGNALVYRREKPFYRLADYVFETEYFYNTMVKSNNPYFSSLKDINYHYFGPKKPNISNQTTTV